MSEMHFVPAGEHLTNLITIIDGILSRHGSTTKMAFQELSSEYYILRDNLDACAPNSDAFGHPITDFKERVEKIRDVADFYDNFMNILQRFHEMGYRYK